MSALTDFEHSIASARSLTAMYAELRQRRGLGRRGRLAPEHEDLLWLPRSAVVAAISALDAYIHAVLYDRVPNALRADPLPAPLADAMASIIPIKNGNGFREALPIILRADVDVQLANRLRTQTLAFLSFQAPEKVQAAYEMIGYPGIFGAVSALWPGPNSAEEDLRRTLANYVKRRNQIAHEGDREATGAVRHMQPEYANKCAAFVENLVTRLNRHVYGP